MLIWVKAHKRLKDALSVFSGHGGAFVGNGDGVGTVRAGMTTHLHGATSSILIRIVEQTVQQVLQQRIGVHLHVVGYLCREFCGQMASLVDGRGVQVPRIQDGFCHFIQFGPVRFGYRRIVAIETEENELVGGGGHMVGITAYAIA